MCEPIQLFNNYAEPLRKNFYQQGCESTPCTQRVGLLGFSILSMVTLLVDTGIGIAAGAVAILTLGLNKKINTFAYQQLGNSNFINPFYFLIPIINPSAEADKNNSIRSIVKPCFSNLTTYFSSSANFIVRHLVLRVTYALLPIAAIVERAIHSLFGAAVGVVALICLGTSKRCNTLARDYFRPLGVIHTLFFYTLRVINPFAE